jgi:hypothetical protein
MNLAEAKIRATELAIPGRSKMNKAELIAAIAVAETPEVVEVETVKAPSKGSRYTNRLDMGQTVPMDMTLRIIGYAKQRGWGKTKGVSLAVVTLTAKQERRIRKQDNKLRRLAGV